jgi:hypothetical protein
VGDIVSLAAWKARLRESVERDAVAQNSKSDEISDGEWLTIRKEAALHIDPETAEVAGFYGNNFDPYDLGNAPDEQLGWNYFARAPESNVWVSFRDLPAATLEAFWKRAGFGGKKSRFDRRRRPRASDALRTVRCPPKCDGYQMDEGT